LTPFVYNNTVGAALRCLVAGAGSLPLAAVLVTGVTSLVNGDSSVLTARTPVNYYDCCECVGVKAKVAVSAAASLAPAVAAALGTVQFSASRTPIAGTPTATSMSGYSGFRLEISAYVLAESTTGDGSGRGAGAVAATTELAAYTRCAILSALDLECDGDGRKLQTARSAYLDVMVNSLSKESGVSAASLAPIVVARALVLPSARPISLGAGAAVSGGSAGGDGSASAVLDAGAIAGIVVAILAMLAVGGFFSKRIAERKLQLQSHISARYGNSSFSVASDAHMANGADSRLTKTYSSSANPMAGASRRGESVSASRRDPQSSSSTRGDRDAALARSEALYRAAALASSNARSASPPGAVRSPSRRAWDEGSASASPPHNFGLNIATLTPGVSERGQSRYSPPAALNPLLARALSSDARRYR
jgi:hypothetical protein